MMSRHIGREIKMAATHTRVLRSGTHYSAKSTEATDTESVFGYSQRERLQKFAVVLWFLMASNSN